MRVALQLTAIAKALLVIRIHEGVEDLTEKDLKIIDWCGYSLANEEKRACLKVLAQIEFETTASTQSIADKIGLNTSVIGNILQNLASVGVIVRGGNSETNSLQWKLTKKEDWEIIEGIEDILTHIEREVTLEEDKENNEILDDIMSKM